MTLLSLQRYQEPLLPYARQARARRPRRCAAVVAATSVIVLGLGLVQIQHAPSRQTPEITLLTDTSSAGTCTRSPIFEPQAWSDSFLPSQREIQGSERQWAQWYFQLYLPVRWVLKRTPLRKMSSGFQRFANATGPPPTLPVWRQASVDQGRSFLTLRSSGVSFEEDHDRAYDRQNLLHDRSRFWVPILLSKIMLMAITNKFWHWLIIRRRRHRDKVFVRKFSKKTIRRLFAVYHVSHNLFLYTIVDIAVQNGYISMSTGLDWEIWNWWVDWLLLFLNLTAIAKYWYCRGSDVKDSTYDILLLLLPGVGNDAHLGKDWGFIGACFLSGQCQQRKEFVVIAYVIGCLSIIATYTPFIVLMIRDDGTAVESFIAAHWPIIMATDKVEEDKDNFSKRSITASSLEAVKVGDRVIANYENQWHDATVVELPTDVEPRYKVRDVGLESKSLRDLEPRRRSEVLRASFSTSTVKAKAEHYEGWFKQEVKLSMTLAFGSTHPSELCFVTLDGEIQEHQAFYDPLTSMTITIGDCYTAEKTKEGGLEGQYSKGDVKGKFDLVQQADKYEGWLSELHESTSELSFAFGSTQASDAGFLSIHDVTNELPIIVKGTTIAIGKYLVGTKDEAGHIRGEYSVLDGQQAGEFVLMPQAQTQRQADKYHGWLTLIDGDEHPMSFAFASCQVSSIGFIKRNGMISEVPIIVEDTVDAAANGDGTGSTEFGGTLRDREGTAAKDVLASAMRSRSQRRRSWLGAIGWTGVSGQQQAVPQGTIKLGENFSCKLDETGSLRGEYIHGEDRGEFSLSPKDAERPRSSAGHIMVISDSNTYDEYVCNQCENKLCGQRWFCAASDYNYCFECRPFNEAEHYSGTLTQQRPTQRLLSISFAEMAKQRSQSDGKQTESIGFLTTSWPDEDTIISQVSVRREGGRIGIDEFSIGNGVGCLEGSIDQEFNLAGEFAFDGRTSEFVLTPNFRVGTFEGTIHVPDEERPMSFTFDAANTELVGEERGANALRRKQTAFVPPPTTGFLTLNGSISQVEVNFGDTLKDADGTASASTATKSVYSIRSTRMGARELVIGTKKDGLFSGRYYNYGHDIRGSFKLTEVPRLRGELEAMKNSELIQRARKAGIPERDYIDAVDAEDIPAALMKLILEASDEKSRSRCGQCRHWLAKTRKNMMAAQRGFVFKYSRIMRDWLLIKVVPQTTDAKMMVALYNELPQAALEFMFGIVFGFETFIIVVIAVSLLKPIIIGVLRQVCFRSVQNSRSVQVFLTFTESHGDGKFFRIKEHHDLYALDACVIHRRMRRHVPMLLSRQASHDLALDPEYWRVCVDILNRYANQLDDIVDKTKLDENDDWRLVVSLTQLNKTLTEAEAQRWVQVSDLGREINTAFHQKRTPDLSVDTILNRLMGAIPQSVATRNSFSVLARVLNERDNVEGSSMQVRLLFWAAQNNNEEVLNVILDSCPDLDALLHACLTPDDGQKQDGRIALEVAFERGAVKAARGIVSRMSKQFANRKRERDSELKRLLEEEHLPAEYCKSHVVQTEHPYAAKPNEWCRVIRIPDCKKLEVLWLCRCETYDSCSSVTLRNPHKIHKQDESLAQCFGRETWEDVSVDAGGVAVHWQTDGDGDPKCRWGFAAAVVPKLVSTTDDKRNKLKEVFLHNLDTLDVNPDEKLGATGKTMLMQAAAVGDEASVQLLIDAGASVNLFVREEGHEASVQLSALTCAMRGLAAKNVDADDIGGVVKKLLEAGADPDLTRDRGGRTALMLAVLGGSIEIVEDLLVHGADGTLVDEKGNTAEKLAKKSSKELLKEIANILRNRSGKQDKAMTCLGDVTKLAMGARGITYRQQKAAALDEESAALIIQHSFMRRRTKALEARNEASAAVAPAEPAAEEVRQSQRSDDSKNSVWGNFGSVAETSAIRDFVFGSTLVPSPKNSPSAKSPTANFCLGTSLTLADKESWALRQAAAASTRLDPKAASGVADQAPHDLAVVSQVAESSNSQQQQPLAGSLNSVPVDFELPGVVFRSNSTIGNHSVDRKPQSKAAAQASAVAAGKKRMNLSNLLGTRAARALAAKRKS